MFSHFTAKSVRRKQKFPRLKFQQKDEKIGKFMDILFLKRRRLWYNGK